MSNILNEKSYCRKWLIYPLLSVLSLSIGCSEDLKEGYHPFEEVHGMFVSPSKVSLDEDNDFECEVRLYSNQSWKVEENEYVSVSPSSGLGTNGYDQIIKVTANGEYRALNDLEGEITITDATNHEFNTKLDYVLQGNYENIDKVLNLDYEASTQYLDISFTRPWKIEFCVDWITLSQTSGTKLNGINVSVSENLSSEERIGEIVFECANQSFLFVIMQSCRPSDDQQNESDNQQNDDGVTVKTFTVNGVSFKMIPVEGGTFKMGADDPDAESFEKPVHDETVCDFMIGETEVTQALWEAVMGTKPSAFKVAYFPVEQVSWDECQEFINKLNELSEQNFRLPTESEWEYAAQGGNKSNGYKYSGSNNIDEVAWYSGNSSAETHKVGTKKANELGIYDMSGNVSEWTSSYWRTDYNEYTIENESWRVRRGGSWYYSARYCRVSYRTFDLPYSWDNTMGLRLAL